MTLELCARLGVLPLLDVPRTAGDLCDVLGFVPSFARPLRWLLERLRLAGVLACDDDSYRRIATPPTTARDALRAAGLAKIGRAHV